MKTKLQKQYKELPNPKPSWKKVEPLIDWKAVKQLQTPKILRVKDDEFKLVIVEGSKEPPKKDFDVTYQEALDKVHERGLELMNEEEYRYLLTLGDYDSKSWVWLDTPEEILIIGAALSGGRDVDDVYVGRTFASNHHGYRAFRGSLRVDLGLKSSLEPLPSPTSEVE